MIKIRRIKNPEKYKEILKKIYLDSYEGVNPEYYEKEDEDVESYFEWLFDKAKDGFILALKDSKIVGFLVLDLDWYDKNLKEKVAEIHEICIKKKFQKKGIGEKLVRYAEKLAKRYNLNYLCGWVGIENITSLSFFKKLNFVEGEIGWQIWKRIRKKLSDFE